ncbi:MAG: aspartate-semialdehyde dehydrogenase [Acidobacteriota bacterium]|nr:aspartate-semialdehyde dehydrogenase [Acidobacteriota bacterium]
MANQIDVGILGATGTVGQQFVTALENHPWFRIAWIAASERSAGKRYVDATPWRLDRAIPGAIADMEVQRCDPSGSPMLVFSGLDSSVAGSVESSFAVAGRTVVSNAKNYRMDSDVPLLIPEINADHLDLLQRQSETRAWPGKIVTNPNCSTIIMTLALAPLCQFGLERVMVTTLQAISGAGYPGVSSLDILGNIVPHIPGEETKIELETQKILGSLSAGSVQPHDVVVSAQATRVPVLNGHTVLISVKLTEQPTHEGIADAFRSYHGRPQVEGLPSAPKQPIVYMSDPDRPQPRYDVNRENGMAVTVGRLRKCPVLGYKFIALGHNTVRGAAGAAILNAELMKVDNLL